MYSFLVYFVIVTLMIFVSVIHALRKMNSWKCSKFLINSFRQILILWQNLHDIIFLQKAPDTPIVMDPEFFHKRGLACVISVEQHMSNAFRHFWRLFLIETINQAPQKDYNLIQYRSTCRMLVQSMYTGN